MICVVHMTGGEGLVLMLHDIDRRKLHNALVRDDETARRQGLAIAICHPKGTTPRALNEWPPELRERSFAARR